MFEVKEVAITISCCFWKSFRIFDGSYLLCMGSLGYSVLLFGSVVNMFLGV